MCIKVPPILSKTMLIRCLMEQSTTMNSTLTTTYNRIATLEAEVTYLKGELTRLPGGNVISKAKVPKPPIFADSENKMHLYDWLSQIALYYSVSSITVDD